MRVRHQPGFTRPRRCTSWRRSDREPVEPAALAKQNSERRTPNAPRDERDLPGHRFFTRDRRVQPQFHLEYACSRELTADGQPEPVQRLCVVKVDPELSEQRRVRGRDRGSGVDHTA